MSVRRSFDNLMHDWLDEGPDGAPREDLAAVLAALPRTRQRGRIRQWRIPMPIQTRLAIAAALVVAVGAVALYQLTPKQNIGGQIAPTPSAAQPTPTDGWNKRFPLQSATKFRDRFTYAVDPKTGLGFAPCCQPDAGSYQFRIPEGAAGEWSLPILVVSIQGGLREDYCHDTGGRVNTSPSPQDFVDYVAGVQGLVVTKLPDAVIDGRTAKGVDIQLGPAPSSCGDLWLFEGAASYSCCQPEGNTRRTYAIEVDGDLVLLTIPFTPDKKDRNLALAWPLIDSIRFESRPVSSSAPAGS